MRYALGAWLGGRLLAALLATCRFREEGAEHYQRYWRAGRPVVFVLWHGRLLPCTYYHRGRGVAPMISRSGDGEYIARVVEDWGFVPVRGSSSRGGSSALRELVRLARAGHSLALTPDGPRGPRQAMKPGALLAAQMAGLPMVPVSAGASRGWWFEGWDRFLVPRPFARVRLVYGAPVEIARDATPAQLQATADALEAELNRLTADVDRRSHAW